MRKTPRLLFVLSDGGRARLVERSPENGHFRTVREIDGARMLEGLRHELRASPPGRSFASVGARRAAVGRERYVREAKTKFVGSVAEEAVALCHSQGIDGVVIVAPGRLIADLRHPFEGKVAVVNAIRKDLTKTPDADLGAWLNHLFTLPSLAT
ncbi:MAG: host attachment protein [Proteobacteria bacterium]|nr:host attachment protein [Pseudomonadota bacterium]